MLLKSVRPINWGPFSTTDELEVEPDTTVLTSSNDAGKSSLLRLIDAAYRFPAAGDVRKSDLNIEYSKRSQNAQWEVDREVGCEVRFTATELTRRYISINPGSPAVESGDELRVKYNLAPRALAAAVEVVHDGKVRRGGVQCNRMPHVIGLPTEHRVGDVVSFSPKNHAERLLLQIAFGAGFTAEKAKAYGRALFLRELRSAEGRLNEALSSVIPPSLSLSLQLHDSGSQTEIAIQPFDHENGYAPLGSRGDGVQLLISLMVSLLEAKAIDDQVLIWIDEPETSLHADAQHVLRTLLEDLAREDRIQVIWATHSSAMINNMRPRTVRLLRRDASGDAVCTRIANRPIDNNWTTIRSSLGMSASDSLQFAPVVIVVEGASEALGIQMLLQRLCDCGAPGFADVPRLAPNCHIADGEGDTYVRMAKFCLTQCPDVIVFLDGDKKVEKKTKEQLPTVSFIQVEDGEEIEQLLDVELYFSALASDIADAGALPTAIATGPEAFNAWLQGQPETVKRKMFTKKLDDWLSDVLPSYRFSKPRVLKRAIASVTTPGQVRQSELLALVAEICRRLPKPH